MRHPAVRTWPVPRSSPEEPLTDVIVKHTYNPDDGHMQTEIHDCYPWEVAALLPALAKLRRRSRWPRSPKSLIIESRNGKQRLVWGDRIVSVTTRPSRQRESTP